MIIVESNVMLTFVFNGFIINGAFCYNIVFFPNYSSLVIAGKMHGADPDGSVADLPTARKFLEAGAIPMMDYGRMNGEKVLAFAEGLMKG